MVESVKSMPPPELYDIERLTGIEMLNTNVGAKYTINNKVYRVRINRNFTISFKLETHRHTIFSFFRGFEEIDNASFNNPDVLSLFTVVMLYRPTTPTTEKTRIEYLFSESISNDIKVHVLSNLTDEQLFDFINEVEWYFFLKGIGTLPKESKAGKQFYGFIKNIKSLPKMRLDEFVKFMAEKLNEIEPKSPRFIRHLDCILLMISELSIGQNMIFKENIKTKSIACRFICFYFYKNIKELEECKQVILLLAYSSPEEIYNFINIVDEFVAGDDFESERLQFKFKTIKFLLLMVRTKLEAGVTPPLLNEVREYYKSSSTGRAYVSTCCERIFEHENKIDDIINGFITLAKDNSQYHDLVKDMVLISIEHPDFEPLSSCYKINSEFITPFAADFWEACSQMLSDECRIINGGFDEDEDKNKSTMTKLASTSLILQYLNYICSVRNLDKVLCFKQAFLTLNSQQIEDLYNSNKRFFLDEIIPAIINSSAEWDERAAAIAELLLKTPTILALCLIELPENVSNRLVLLINKNKDEVIKQIIRRAKCHLKTQQIEVVLLSELSLSVKRNLINFCLENNNRSNNNNGKENLVSLISHLSFSCTSILCEMIPKETLVLDIKQLRDELPQNNKKLICLPILKLLKSPIDPALKRYIVNALTFTELECFLSCLSNTSKEKIITFLSVERHKQLLDKMIDKYRETKERFVILLNMLPATSFRVLYEHTDAKTLYYFPMLLVSKDITELTQCRIASLVMSPESIQLLLFPSSQTSNLNCWKKVEIIETAKDVEEREEAQKNAYDYSTFSILKRLTPKTVMQLNRKLSYEQWEDISKKLKNDELHLWVDFVSEKQVKFWRAKINRKDEIELLLVFDAARSIDLLTHTNLNEIAKKLLGFTVEDAAKCIQKLCSHSIVIPILIYIYRNDLSNLKIVKQIFEHILTNGRESADAVTTKLYFRLTYISKNVSINERGEITQPNIVISRIHSFEDTQDAIKQYMKYITEQLTDVQPKKTNIDRIAAAYIEHKKLVAHKKRQASAEEKIHEPTKRKHWSLTSLKNQERFRRNYPFIFHYDLQEVYPPIPEPIKTVTDSQQQALQRASQTPILIDNQSVTYIAKDAVNPLGLRKEDYIRQRLLLKKLAKRAKTKGEVLHSISPGVIGIINCEGRLTAARSGSSLKQLLQTSSAFELRLFKDACHDLKLLHSWGYHLGEIKPDNYLVIDTVENREGYLHRLPRPQLKLCDIENLALWSCSQEESEICPSLGEHNICGAIGYTTMKLIYLPVQPETNQTIEQFDAKDEYAFLIMILESISPEFRKINERHKSIIKEHAPQLFKAVTENTKLSEELIPLTLGICGQLSTQEDADRKCIMQLLIKCIKPEYVGVVTAFLVDPFLHPLSYKAPLFDVIKWGAFE